MSLFSTSLGNHVSTSSIKRIMQANKNGQTLREAALDYKNPVAAFADRILKAIGIDLYADKDAAMEELATKIGVACRQPGYASAAIFLRDRAGNQHRFIICQEGTGVELRQLFHGKSDKVLLFQDNVAKGDLSNQ